MRGALESSLKGLSIGAEIVINGFRRRKISPKAAEEKVFSTRQFFLVRGFGSAGLPWRQSLKKNSTELDPPSPLQKD